AAPRARLSLGRPPNKPRTPHRTDTEQSPDAHRTRRAFWLCAFRCAEGARDGVLARPAFPAVLMTPIFQSHFFLAGSKQERRGSRVKPARSLCAAWRSKRSGEA